MAKKQRLFSNNTPYVSKYYSRTARKITKSKKIIKASSDMTHDRYKAIMDIIPKSERDNARSTYASDEIFEIGEDIAYNDKTYEKAHEDFDEMTKARLRKLRELQNKL